MLRRPDPTCGRTDKNLCRCFGAPATHVRRRTGRVFPDHLITYQSIAENAHSSSHLICRRYSAGVFCRRGAGAAISPVGRSGLSGQECGARDRNYGDGPL